jgi:hypothetical protein
MAALPARTPPTDAERIHVQQLHNRFAGKRCFIVGNGPSLNKHDLTLLKDEFSFGVNGIFYKTREMGYRPTFYVVEDSHVVDDNLEAIKAYDAPYKFFLTMYRDKIPAADNTYFVAGDLGFYRKSHPFGGTPRFSRDASECVFAGQSVTYINMQLAYYLGFTEVYLIGMDFTYVKPDTVKVSGNTWESTEDDPNHFHPDYFGKGKRWHDPMIENVALNYENAKRVFERNGRRIMNATIGGQLEVFERADYLGLFAQRG